MWVSQCCVRGEKLLVLYRRERGDNRLLRGPLTLPEPPREAVDTSGEKTLGVDIAVSLVCNNFFLELDRTFQLRPSFSRKTH